MANKYDTDKHSFDVLALFASCVKGQGDHHIHIDIS